MDVTTNESKVEAIEEGRHLFSGLSLVDLDNDDDQIKFAIRHGSNIISTCSESNDNSLFHTPKRKGDASIERSVDSSFISEPEALIASDMNSSCANLSMVDLEHGLEDLQLLNTTINL
jgi:hypothetical protein